MPRRLLLPAVLALALVPAPAHAASTCGAAGIAVQPLQTGVFYVDVATQFLGSYVGYRVRNTSPATPQRGLWVRLQSFTGGVVTPAEHPTQTSPTPLEALAPGGQTTAFAYLKATGPTTAVQRHDVVVWSGRPGAGGTELCRETQTITAVADVIKAAANKVTGATVSAAQASLGATFELTVSGETGTIGTGTSTGDVPGVVRFSPAVAANWPAGAFRLVSVRHRLPLTGTAVPDVLFRSGLEGSGNTPYDITWTFRVVGPTSGPTPLAPVQNIASGTQVKHTDQGSFGALPPIPAVSSSATLAVTAAGTQPYDPGEVVPVTATVTNGGGSPIELDELDVRLPAGWTAQPGSATRDGAAIPDPVATTPTELHLVGPFTVPAGGASRFRIELVAGAVGTGGSIRATGVLAGGQVDATTAVADDTPASVAVRVLDAPTAVDDAQDAVAGVTNNLDVLGNDLLDGGAATLAITGQGTKGVATVSGGRIAYAADPGVTGTDSFTYEVTTPGGTDSAAVTVTFVPPPAPVAPGTLTTSGQGTATQTAAVDLPPGGGLVLEPGGVPTLAVTGGTYTADPVTATVSFAPELGFTGSPAPVTFTLSNSDGLTATGTYAPAVLAPPGPAPAGLASTGPSPDVQTRTAVPPPQGGVRLRDGGLSVLTVSVTGGRYDLDASTGAIAFTPAPGFVGAPTPVTFRVTDAYGQHGDAVFQPFVTAPGPPAPPSAASSGTGTRPQGTTVAVPPGGGVVLQGPNGQTGTVVVVPEGTYRLSPDTGALTFTAVLGFAGTPTPVGVAVSDAFGQTTVGSYAPAVAAPPPPTSAPRATTAGPGVVQTTPVEVPEGGTLVLLDDDDAEVEAVVLPGVGTYAATTTALTFSPAPGHTGAVPGVRFRVTDAYGGRAEATYAALVEVLGAAASEPPPAAAPVPEAAARRCASRRAMTLNWKVPRGVRLRSQQLVVDGRVASRLQVRARRASVLLHGRTAGQHADVRVVAVTTRGRRLETRRTYRPCIERRARPPLETLRLR